MNCLFSFIVLLVLGILLEENQNRFCRRKLYFLQFFSFQIDSEKSVYGMI